MTERRIIITSEIEFDRLMEEIDGEMRAQDVPIRARDLKAFSMVAERVEPGLILGPLDNLPPTPGSYSGIDLSKRVRNWIKARYGKKLNVDMGLGEVPVLIRGDLYKLYIPRIFGSAHFVCEPEYHGQKHYPTLSRNAPVVVNVLDNVEDLTTDLSNKLSAVELRAIRHVFITSYLRLEAISRIGKAPFVGQALAEFRTSLQSMSDRPAQYGNSRWASSMAAEKMFKAFLNSAGQKYPKGPDGHDLTKLADLTAKNGGPILQKGLIDTAQCSAGERYESSATLKDAIGSFEASLTLCAQVANNFVPRLVHRP